MRLFRKFRAWKSREPQKDDGAEWGDTHPDTGDLKLYLEMRAPKMVPTLVKCPDEESTRENVPRMWPIKWLEISTPGGT